MRATEIESWVIQILDRIALGQRIEDLRVELKSELPSDPVRAARRIAGHLNAGRGDAALWIIGVDEKTGEVGRFSADHATWLQQVRTYFEGVHPEVQDVIVPYGSGSVLALLFDPDRLPFVTRNPDFGQAGVPAEWEVPWRDSTRVRSATRTDLLRLLIPSARQPLHLRARCMAAGTSDKSSNVGIRIVS